MSIALSVPNVLKVLSHLPNEEELNETKVVDLIDLVSGFIRENLKYLGNQLVKNKLASILSLIEYKLKRMRILAKNKNNNAASEKLDVLDKRVANIRNGHGLRFARA